MSTYNPVTKIWQASGDVANVNVLLANLIFKPTTNSYKGFAVAVTVIDSYGQSLHSTMNAVGNANVVTKNSAQLIGGIIGGVLGAAALVVTSAGILIYRYIRKYNAAEAELESELTEFRSWAFELSLKPPRNTVEYYKLIPAGDVDLRTVVDAYQRAPVPHMDIKSVEIIYSPNLEQAFNTRIKILQEKAGNPAFTPKWTKNGQLELRGAIMDYLEQIVAPYKEEQYNAVKLLPVWHGTRPEILDSIFKTGYANLAATDEGYFGKGLYAAYEAKYAYQVYSQGSLLVNWISFFSAFPVVDGDMEQLRGKGSYGNYDAHFVPVRPASSALNEDIYYPCQHISDAVYHELVVFEAAQCLPRYLVHLQPSLPQSMSPIVAPTLAPGANDEVTPEKQAEAQDTQVEPAPQACGVFPNPHSLFAGSRVQGRLIYRTAMAKNLSATPAGTMGELPLDQSVDLQRQKR